MEIAGVKTRSKLMEITGGTRGKPPLIDLWNEGQAISILLFAH